MPRFYPSSINDKRKTWNWQRLKQIVWCLDTEFVMIDSEIK